MVRPGVLGFVPVVWINPLLVRMLERSASIAHCEIRMSRHDITSFNKVANITLCKVISDVLPISKARFGPSKRSSVSSPSIDSISFTGKFSVQSKESRVFSEQDPK